MNAPNAIITSKIANVATAPRIRPNPARLRKPSPLPLRPLAPNRFKPPKGEKKVFLPNFTLTFLRTPRQPPHFASFLTPLWLNKLDLKDYLYNLYGVQALRVRSFIINGKVTRNDRTNRLTRSRPTKKMTVELVQGGGEAGQGPFVWPEEPREEEWAKEEREKEEEVLKERMKRRVRGERHEVGASEEERMRVRARALLEGRARWRPSWEENGGAMATAMARGDGR